MRTTAPTIEQAIEASLRETRRSKTAAVPSTTPNVDLRKLAAALRELPEAPLTLEDLYAVKTASSRPAPAKMGGSARGDELRKLAAALRDAGDLSAQTRATKVAHAVEAAKGLMLLRQRRGL